MKDVLLYYSFAFAFGGGDLLPLALAAALQDQCRLTFAADVPENLERAADLYRVPVDLSKVRLVRLLPKGYTAKTHTLLDSFRRSRNLKRLAARADVRLSASNIMDFGRPAHHFVNVLGFGNDGFEEFARHRMNAEPATTRPPFGRAAREALLRPLLAMRSKRAVIRDPRERIYPNSRFVHSLMEEFYGPFGGEVFYPPTLFDPGPAPGAARDPLSVVCIGRIIPDKRIVDIVGIVEKARALSGLDLRLRIAGRLDQSPAYGRTLSRMAEERPWLQFPGTLHGPDKDAFLFSGTYALHAMREEAFGIAVTEYLKAGLIPLVPDEGGSREVVDNPALTFHSHDEAARLLARLLVDRDFRDAQRRRCAERARFFAREAYLERQDRLLRGILNGARNR